MQALPRWLPPVAGPNVGSRHPAAGAEPPSPRGLATVRATVVTSEQTGGRTTMTTQAEHTTGTESRGPPAWVDEVAALTTPDAIHWVDGSDEEWDAAHDPARGVPAPSSG